VRTLFLTSFFTSFFLCFFLCFFCFHIFFGLIVKQIFEEKGKFIFIFLQIPQGGVRGYSTLSQLSRNSLATLSHTISINFLYIFHIIIFIIFTEGGGIIFKYLYTILCTSLLNFFYLTKICNLRIANHIYNVRAHIQESKKLSRRAYKLKNSYRKIYSKRKAKLERIIYSSY
jgi:hypothetical protein